MHHLTLKPSIRHGIKQASYAIWHVMLLQGLSTPLHEEVEKEHPKKFPKKKAKSKAKKVANLTLDEQIKCYARIVVNQLFTELGLDENK